ncbi:MAG: hypothetical protein WDO24_01760 [Pseudomonadota bacterium]
MRWQWIAVIGLALAGCAAPAQTTLWPGPDWRTTAPPPSAATVADDSAGPTPRHR